MSARAVTVAPELLAELQSLYADYAAALDEGRYQDWIDLFAEDCSYRLQPRENFERALPLATLWLESKGMLRDRVFGIEQTLFHAPYAQRHVIGPLRVLEAPPDGPIRVEASYAVFRTRVQQPSEVFNVGRYVDEVVRESGALRFRAKLAVFDSEMVLNSIIYPI